MRKCLAIVGLASCCAARATPVYLECVTQRSEFNPAATYRITLDEEAGVAVFSEGARSFKSQTLPAQFTRSDVRFIAVMPLAKLSVEYRIYRASLKFSRLIKDGSHDLQYGTCKSTEADENASEALRDQPVSLE